MIVKSEAGHLIGPFASYEILEDRLVCDSMGLCFSVIGNYEIILANPSGRVEDYSWDGENFVYHAPVVPVEVPQEVTMRQARLALLHAGYLDVVNTAVANMAGTTGDIARIEWNYSKGVERHKELVIALTAGFGWSEAFVDNLFIEAAKL